MEEADFVQKSREGDAEAFASLVKRSRHEIFRLCLQILRDSDRAEDITQEAFLIAYRKLDQFEGRSSFTTWVFQIAKRLAIKAQEKDKPLPLNEEILSDQSSVPLSSRMAEDEELREAIHRGLSQLSEKQRVVFQRFDLEQKSHKEIAEELNICIGTVRSRLHYARQKMRVFLKDYFETSSRSLQ